MEALFVGAAVQSNYHSFTGRSRVWRSSGSRREVALSPVQLVSRCVFYCLLDKMSIENEHNDRSDVSGKQPTHFGFNRVNFNQLPSCVVFSIEAHVEIKRPN